MGLINLVTNLPDFYYYNSKGQPGGLGNFSAKSLRYGDDRKDGGDSNQPYITSPIPNGDAPSSPDFLLRNGYLNPVSSFNDVKRLSKFFTDTKTPNGLLFTIKQQLLERQNPKLVNVKRIYNPLGTLAQAGLNSLGFHFNKQGLIPIYPSYFNGGTYGYYYATKGFGFDPENRLTIAYTAKVEKKSLGLLSLNPFGISNLTGNGILMSYPGGPNSILGFGVTNIRIQNPTRTVDLLPFKTTFSLKLGGDIITNKNYLTYTGKPSIYWVYDKYKFSISNQAIFDLDLENNQDILFTNNVNNLLNRSNDNVTSTLYAPLRENTLEINRLGTDPSKPEYYTPTSLRVSNYGYQISSSGVTKAAINRFNLVSQTGGSITASLDNRNDLYFSTANEAGNVGTFPKSTDANNDVYTFDSTQLLDADSAGKLGDTSFGTNVIDFRSTIDAKLGGGKIISTNYSAFNRENKDGGEKEGYGTSKTSFKGNFIPGGPNQGRVLNPNVAISNDQFEIGKNGEDIIDFNFRILNPADTSNNRLIDFRAYLESWSDGVKSNYTDVKYMGRAENFYKYNGFSRDASVEFLVPALSRGDMISNYRKVNMMMWAVAPNYSNIGFMRGNVVEVTIGNYFRSMPSIIKSIDVSEVEGMGWDINRTTDGKNIAVPPTYAANTKGGNVDPNDPATERGSFYVGQLPKGLKITVQFTPLHQFTPEYGQAFIGQNSIYAGPLYNYDTNITDKTGANQTKLSVFFNADERDYFGASPYNIATL